MRRTLPLLALATLAACSLDPKDVRPDLPVPPSWPVGDAYLRQSEAALPSISYRDVFTDPRLQGVIAQALANNRDLRVAAANILAARAQYRVQRAGLLPEIDASARYSRSDGGNGTRSIAGSSTGTGGTTGTGTATGSTGGTSTGTTTGTDTGNGGTGSVTSVSTGASTAFSLDLGSTAFELDLFGRVRSLTRAAQDRYFEQEAAARATRLTLVGEIATAWLTYAADNSLLQVSQQTAASASQTVRLTQARLSGGIAPRSDLTQAQTVLSTAQSDLANQRTLVAQDVNALQLLVGAPVDPSLLPRTIDEAAAMVRPVPAGLDSGILLRRPDVVQAEYELRAANAEIGAARAELFPRVALTALGGLASRALTSLFTGGALNYSVAPSVSYPIFRAGAGKANVAYSRAQREAALASYERSIQSAFREVSDALARQGTFADQLQAQRNGLAAANDTLRLANARYVGGIDPFLNTLDAQRTLYAAQQSLVNTQLVGASNLVTLYRVLGGDSTLEPTSQGPRLIGQSDAPR
jgi:multidrug efflux system outer membrane protein